MADIPIDQDKWREVAEQERVAIHGAARDDKDVRTDRVTAKLLDMCIDLQGKVFAHMTNTGASVREIKDGLERVENRVEEFISAFPNKDAAGHLRDHETRIEEARDKKVFWGKMKFAFWALLMTAGGGWLVIAAWRAFLMGPK